MKRKSQSEKLCDEFCDNCVYMSRMSTCLGLRSCNYYLRTEQRRPGPPGAGCTVKVPMEVHRRKSKQ